MSTVFSKKKEKRSRSASSEANNVSFRQIPALGDIVDVILYNSAASRVDAYFYLQKWRYALRMTIYWSIYLSWGEKLIS